MSVNAVSLGFFKLKDRPRGEAEKSALQSMRAVRACLDCVSVPEVDATTDGYQRYAGSCWSGGNDGVCVTEESGSLSAMTPLAAAPQRSFYLRSQTWPSPSRSSYQSYSTATPWR
jgi:hypothetical protein